MTRTLFLAAVLAAVFTLPAIAGDTTPAPAPEAGAETAPSGNPFTMDDARKHLMQQGYTNVSELVKDA